MKKIMLFPIVLCVLLILVACSPKNEYENKEFEREDVEVSFQVTSGANQNETGNGWTGGSIQQVTKTFLSNPSRVAIYSYDALDILDYANIEDTSITMLGFPKGNLPMYLNAYNQQTYFNLGTLFIPDWDALDLFQPELIILGSRSAGAYDRLVSQFPNADILDMSMVYGEYKEGFERNIQNLSKIFPSIQSKLNEAFTDIQSKMNEVKQVAKDYEALFIMVNGESLSFYGETGRFAALFDEFGFISADSNQEGGSHGNVVGYEYVKMVDPQILFLLDRGLATGGSSTIDFVKENQLIKNTKAGLNQDIYTLDPIAWYISTGGIQSTYQMIDDLMIFVNKI